jgi:hypothetical protein
MADAVALGMKEWALERGATHYSARHGAMTPALEIANQNLDPQMDPWASAFRRPRPSVLAVLSARLRRETVGPRSLLLCSESDR